MSEQERDVFFNGRRDEDGKVATCGMINIRGIKTAEEIKATVGRLQAAPQSPFMVVS
jgi:hypothetical protein